jgi:glyoxylase-like metal-dependent hydrolase (beta-lactamase superfamily II)
VIRVVRVLAPNPSVYTLDGTNTWIVGEDPSFVIDPGPPDEEHLREVARAAGRVAAVLVTHDHEDHAEGAATLAETVGAPLRAWRLPGAQRLRDEETITAGGCSLVAIHTPGHSSDHVCFWLAEEAALFTGDTVLGRGTSFLDPPGGDLERYLHSLGRLERLGPRTIFPGHGPVVLDGAGKLREYVAHRAEREEQILDALAEGPRTVPSVVAEIYADVPEEIHPLAERTVTAHLLKLEAEGRAEKTGRGADQTWTAAAPRTCARCGRRPVRGRGRYCNSCMLTMLQEGGAADGPSSGTTARSGDRTT